MNLYDLQNKIAQKAYNDPDYMQSLKDNPKQILMQELEIDIPEEVEVELVISKPGELNLGLPVNTQQLSEQNLDKVSGGTYKDTTVFDRTLTNVLFGAFSSNIFKSR